MTRPNLVTAKEDREPTVHWPRGGSNSERIYQCPGSVNMATQWPQGESSPAAIDGTHTHSLVEACLRHGCYDPLDLIGEKGEDHEGEYLVTQERAERAKVMVDYVQSRITELMTDGKAPVMYVEEFVDAGLAYGVSQWGGSIDCLITWVNGLEVIDYKDGGFPVNPTARQLVTYAGGALRRIVKSSDADTMKSIEVVRTVVQPKVSPEPKSIIGDAFGLLAELKDLAEQMKVSESLEAPRKAGEHCQFCPGAKMGRCPEYNSGASMVMTRVPVPAGNAPIQLDKIGEETSNEVLETILDAEPMVLGIIKEAKEEALKRVMSGNGPEGYDVGTTDTKRRYVEGAKEAIVKLRVPKKVYLDEKLKTPKQLLEGQAFKALPEVKQEKLRALVEKPPGNPKLIRAGKSPSARINMQEVVKKIPVAEETTTEPATPRSFL